MTPIYLHPGKRLGTSYELEALLGTGQYGQVWRAKKLAPAAEGTVALKVPLDPNRGEEVLMADGRYMLGLPRHPGVVAVNWQGRVGSLWAVEMELVNGPPLSKLMQDEARWAKVTFEDIGRWFSQLADALAFLHGHHIAHGDIKPDNLLFDEVTARLKITDFGTSRRLTDNLIRTFRHAGAWAYQAPEIQLANQRGAVSDLFSLGAVLYHVVTGRLPRASIHELLTTAPITRPRQFNLAVPPHLDELIMELLVDDPARRLPDATLLKQRLEELLLAIRQEPVPPQLPTPPGSGYLDRAVSLLNQGKREEARTAAAEATLHSTGLISALELYARLSAELGYTDDAVGAYRRLITLEMTPGETRRAAQSALADIFLSLHRYEDAEEHVEAALQKPPVPKPTLFRCAIVLGACNKLARALEVLETLTVENPADGAVLEKKAWVLWLLHRYEDAARAFREALRIMPESEICLRRLVDYETLVGNPSRAEHYRGQLAKLSG
jgi:tetratricopeptide (TPR) repeat protein